MAKPLPPQRPNPLAMNVLDHRRNHLDGRRKPLDRLRERVQLLKNLLLLRVTLDYLRDAEQEEILQKLNSLTETVERLAANLAARWLRR